MNRNYWVFAGVLALGLVASGPVRADDESIGSTRWRGGESGKVEPRRIVPVPDDPVEPLDIEVWMRGGDDRTYFPGDRVTFYFRTNRDAFVFLYDVDTEGRVHQIYPRSAWDEEFVQGGVTYAVPGPGAGYRLMVTGPAGREDIVALASDRPLSGRWDLCWGGITSSNDFDDLGGVRLRMGRLGANRISGMTEVTEKLVEVPVNDPYSDTASDQLTFRVGRRHGNDYRGPFEPERRSRRGRSRW